MVVATGLGGTCAINLTAHADAALLEAERQGRDRVVIMSELASPAERGLVA